MSPLRPDLGVEIKTSTFDWTNAALISAILFASFLFAVMFCIWISGGFGFIENVGGGDVIKPGDPIATNSPLVDGDEIIEPDDREFPEIETSDLAQELSAVSEVSSTLSGSTSNSDGQAKKTGIGSRSGTDLGPEIGPVGTPIHQRWSIIFEADRIDAYIQQMEFFDIDIAAIHKIKNDIWRVRFSDGESQVINSNRERENGTLRFLNRKNTFRRWDKEICRRSGIDTKDVITAQFFPGATAQQMAAIESAAVEKLGRTVEEVRKTTFRVVAEGDGYRMEVVDVEFL